MKYLFLDIDGVLNRDSTKELSITKFIGLDQYLVDKFKNWYSTQKNLSIILSSTWREDPVMVEEIIAAGIPLLDKTQRTKFPRGYEIESWLVSNAKNNSKYAILDDTAAFFKHQLPFFVQTSPIHGLKDKDLIKLNRILQ